MKHEEKELSRKQEEALKELSGIASGYERYAQRESILDPKDEAEGATKAADRNITHKPEDESSYGISSGYERFSPR